MPRDAGKRPESSSILVGIIVKRQVQRFDAVGPQPVPAIAGIRVAQFTDPKTKTRHLMKTPTCHGSRFDKLDGHVLNGPAIAGLTPGGE